MTTEKLIDLSNFSLEGMDKQGHEFYLNLEKAKSIIISDPRIQSDSYGLFGEVTTCGLETKEKWEASRNRAIRLDLDFRLQINKSILWLRYVNKIQNVNTKHSSYGLKHYVERYLKTSKYPENNYVCNGAFIIAAKLCEFKIYGLGNVCFNMSERSIKSLSNCH